MDEENNNQENEEINKGIDKLKDIFIKKNLWVVIALIILLFFVWQTRTINIPGLKDITTDGYTLGPDLDPFLFLRYAQYIVEHGSLMEHDSMRYVPLEFDTTGETILLPYMMAYLHKFLKVFKPVSIEYSAVIFPAIMFILTALVFFLFIRKIFEKNKNKDIIAFLSTAFLSFSSSLLPRTVAGIPEKESVGFFFMFLAFYLFLSAWKTDKFKKAGVLGLAAGISTALMALVWGGVVFVFFSVSFSALIAFIFGKVGKKEAGVYSVWILSSVILIPLFSNRFSFIAMISSSSSGFGLAVFFIMLVDFVIFNTKIKNLSLIEKMGKKIPSRIVSLILALILLAIISSLFLGVNFIPLSAKEIITSLTNPYTDRHSLTVAENRQPYFDEWQGSFGPVVRGVSLLFWLFFVGSVFLFYKTFRKIRKKERVALTLAYILFLFGLIFSRYSGASTMNGENAISRIAYFGSFLVFFAVAAYIYYKDYKKEELENFKEINFMHLFLIAYFIIGLIGARSAIRLVMGLVPSVAAIAGFFIVESVEIARKQEDKNIKFIAFVVAAGVVISGVYALYINYEITKAGARNMVPSVYTHQWQNAMAWVRENTPENAVFGHWWDYGYWVQTIGKRATILDGGNAVGYWNHLLAMHVLTADSEREALEFLYAHNSTHLLIDSTDIGKYGAYSSIGSDENYNKYSWIGTFFLNEQATQETKDMTTYVYQGGVTLDEDYKYKSDSGEIFFPARNSGVGVLAFNLGNNNEIKQPEAVFVYQENQIRIPLRYAYYKNKLYDFGSGYGGTLYILTRVEQQGGGAKINDLGTALFLSERNMRALWVRLYLLGETGNFKLVHAEPDIFITNLKNQGANLGEFVYFNGIRGPIKIWEAVYPAGIEFKEEYLSTDYPKSLMEVKRL